MPPQFATWKLHQTCANTVFLVCIWNLCIQFEDGKIRTTRNSIFTHFPRSSSEKNYLCIFRHGAYISHALQMSWYFQCLRINAFLYKQHFCKQHQADILLFENYYIVSASVLSSKNGAYSKERVIKQVCLMLVNLLLPDHRVLLVCHCYLQYTFFLIRTPVFCLSLNFLNIMLEIRLRYS